MGTSVSTPMRGPTSTLSLTQFLQKFLICLGSGYREIGPFQPMHVDRGLLNCPTSPSHEKQTKSDQTKISLSQSSDWMQPSKATNDYKQGQKSLSKKWLLESSGSLDVQGVLVKTYVYPIVYPNLEMLIRLISPTWDPSPENATFRNQLQNLFGFTIFFVSRCKNSI